MLRVERLNSSYFLLPTHRVMHYWQSRHLDGFVLRVSALYYKGRINTCGQKRQAMDPPPF
jgi:hypothetical protein